MTYGFKTFRLRLGLPLLSSPEFSHDYYKAKISIARTLQIRKTFSNRCLLHSIIQLKLTLNGTSKTLFK